MSSEHRRHSSSRRARRRFLQRRYLTRLKARFLESFGYHPQQGKPRLHIYRLLRDKAHRANRAHVQNCEYCREGLQAAGRRAIPAPDQEW